MITETDELAQALDTAAALWPEAKENRAELLRRLVRAGSESVEHRDAKRLAGRRAAIAACAGSLTDIWPADWREQLRNEWPS